MNATHVSKLSIDQRTHTTTTYILLHKIIIYVLLGLLFFTGQKAKGEDTSSLPTPPQSPAPQQESDRKEGAGAAQIAAIAGAAVAGYGCIMLLNEARKMPPGEEKTKTMKMAMEQCAQAAQSAASAAQNDKAKKAASQNDIPKIAQVQAPKRAEDKKTAEDPPLPTAEETTEDLANNTEIPEPQNLNPPSPLEEPKIDPSFNENAPPLFANNTPSISALKSIDNSRVDFNDNNKDATPTINVPGLTGSGFFNGGKPVNSGELKKLEGTDANPTASKGATRAAKVDENSTSLEGVSGVNSKDEGGNSAFDQLLNQLMGGQPTDPLNTGGFGSGELVALPTNKDTARGPNIFEFASHRYRIATYNESRITLRKPRLTQQPPQKRLAILSQRQF